MEGMNMILNFLVYAFLIHGVIGKRNVLPENTSPEQLGAKPVKTVKTPHGDVYDCIDFFEQPAFDHPLLKNHDYHFDMKPSSIPKDIVDDGNDKIKDRFQRKRIGCPRGTVPIRRTPRETLIDEKPSHPKSQTDEAVPIYYAGTKTKDGIGKIYGASASLSIEDPGVFLDNEFSSSIISIGADHEFLHAGWTVNKQLYGDDNTRFFIWMHAANSSCFNTRCPGFVIVNKDYPLDLLLKESRSGGPRYETKVLVFQEKESGNWWVVGNENEEIGFWPKRLFHTLSDGAYKAYFGGVCATPSDTPSWSQMGNGNRPSSDNTDGNAYSRQMKIVNQDNKLDYAADKSDIFETLSWRYAARNYHMHWYNRKEAWASTLLFGG